MLSIRRGRQSTTPDKGPGRKENKKEGLEWKRYTK